MPSLHLLPDAPISNPSFDRLDRMSFVRSFAEAIRAVKGHDSVVLALAGPWGSGKSSLINLISGELEATSGDERPLVMRFNPWWFSGTNQLVAAFLQQLAAAVSRPEVKDLLGDATVALDHLAKAIAEPGVQSATDDPGSRDMERLRRQVNAIFEKSDRRILVFMDDIDRLTPDEMTQLLLIVRAVADFPSTTYVLAFDHEVVSEAITDKLGVDGRTYLEKVVQLQIDVPLPGRMTLERMVIGQLEAVDPGANSLDQEGQAYFRVLFERGVKHFLTTPRACTRLLNVLRFTYPTMAGQVYFPDMLGISCLMAFSSQSIQAIRTYGEAFVGHCDPSGKHWVKIRRYHKSWMAELPRKDRSSVEAILRLLFPKVAWALNGPLRGEEFIDVWDKQKRICSVRHFDTYFRLGLTAGEAAEYQWQNMVELLDDATAFARSLQRFGPLEDGHGASWVDELLRQASDFVNDKATAVQARNLFQAIMRRGDEIAAIRNDDSENSLRIDPIHGAVSVLLDCLLRMDDPRERFDVLYEAVSKDAGLLTSAELIDLLHYRLDVFAEGEDTPGIEANRLKLRDVIKALDRRILQASRDGELAEHPQCILIAQKWRQFGRRTKPGDWIRTHCTSPERFVSAIMQLRFGSGSEGGGESTDLVNNLPLGFLTEVFDCDQLTQRCDAILKERPEWLTAEQARTVQLLRDTLSESAG
jgi:hypothetical protein